MSDRVKIVFKVLEIMGLIFFLAYLVESIIQEVRK